MVKKTTSPLVIVGVVAFLLILAGGFYMLNTENSQLVNNQEEVLTSTGDCNNAPEIELSMFNADGDNLGTAVTGFTTSVIQNGKYLGAKTLNATEFGYDDSIQVLVSLTNYLDTVVSIDNMKCGSNSLVGYIYATDDSTFKIKNTDGTAVLSDNEEGSTTNQSTSANAMTFPIQIDSNNDESSGELVIVIETNDTEVDSITLSGLGGAVKSVVPEMHADEFSGTSISVAYDIPAILDGATVEGTFKLTPESGVTIGTGNTPVYVTAYSKQSFVDDNGTFGYGVEDASGDSKAEDNFDYDIMIT